MRAEHQQSREVEFTGRDGVEQRREAPDEPGSGDATEGLVLGEAKLVDTIDVEARAGARAVDAASFDLTEASSSASVRRSTEIACGRERIAFMVVSIRSTVTPRFRSLVLARSRAIDVSNTAASQRCANEVRART
jgi:hypothetical protein